MTEKYAWVEEDKFVIENYNNFKPFASFLPSIAGFWGKPLWVFYVNRGQAISSFGSKDKDGAILEFVAANKAWRFTSIQGFRTFLKIDEKFYEPFQNKILENNKIIQRMYITSHTLKLLEINKELNLEFEVEYFTLPNETFPALMRIIHIKNTSNNPIKIECLDGLPIIIPYGLNDFMLKNISRLAEGWYSGVFFETKKSVPVYKLLVEPKDTPEVIPVKGCNFYYGFLENKNNVEYIVDPDVIFGPFKDYTIPVNFITNKNFKNNPLMLSKNKTPCGFGHFKILLQPQEVLSYYSIIGNLQKVKFLDEIIKRVSSKEYFYQKKKENEEIIKSLTDKIYTKSALVEFDGYCRQTFLDNILRGGFPIVLGKNEYKKIYYIFSRIHGDMEREYNNFVIMPEYFSQGNGHYRDVAQNRRCDVFFEPQIKDESLIYFMNLIQLDGYNPMLLMGSRFKIKNKNEFLKIFEKDDKEKIKKFISTEFTLGDFFNLVEVEDIKLPYKKEKFLDILMQYGEKVDHVFPHTGYWSDHWHYNIDLIESFLSVYPEELENLLFNKKVFTFYDNLMVVMPREEKYVLFHNRPRQLNAVYFHPQKQKIIEERKEDKYIVRTKYGKGEIYKTSLIAKLLCLIANKYAILDPEGVGIEMEADRPNWCDALNGLPGLFGSSTCETLELKRLIKFVLKSFEQLKIDENKKIKIAKEVYDLLKDLEKVTKLYYHDNFKLWDERHNLVEKYRQKTIFGISGEEKNISVGEIKEILNLFLQKIEEGINKAIDKKTGVIFSYFTNEVVKYKILKDKKGNVKKNYKGYICITPLKFVQKPLPYFLEGPVHYLRVIEDKKQAKKIHSEILNSELYDKKLKMLKINAPLKNTSLDIGRITVFPRGWLENESIWMHMEYKYLLELLRNNLAEEFWKISKDVLVPFMNPQVYGRSIFENSSFIVSSAHSEKNLHGQGFVGRLSGTTAEFNSIWLAMTCGLKPFYTQDGKLYLKFSPQIPFWLFSKDGIFEFKFLGNTKVIYLNKSKKDTFGENPAKIYKIVFTYNNGKKFEVDGEIIPPNFSYYIREGKVKEILCEMK